MLIVSPAPRPSWPPSGRNSTQRTGSDFPSHLYEQWERLSGHIIGDERTRGSPERDNRMFVEAVLWIVRTGSPWRDLPDVFGPWNSALRRFSRWSAKGIWHRIFTAMADDGDFEYLIVDSTIIR